MTATKTYEELVDAFAKREFSRLSNERRFQLVRKQGVTYETLKARLPAEVVDRMLFLAEEWVLKGLTPGVAK